ncbi:MAG TPA: hypothetical protein VFA56_14065 [Gaiellaceae bacterium]|nr:hypothetical protein [Gaiellaceae bacterium]
MEVRDLLALLHGGGRALRTVGLTATSRTDTEAARRAMERWHRQRAETTVSLHATDPERPRIIEETTRLWLERPDKVREETAGEFARYGVRVGQTWWLYTEHGGAITNNGAANHSAGIGQQYELFVEPAPIIPHFDFRLEGEASQAGRAAARVRATPRFDAHERRLPITLPLGYDEYELLVDSEHGTLLALTAFLDGARAVDQRIAEIAYDEPIPPGTFVFQAPEGEEIEDVTRLHDVRDEPVEEIAKRTSFPVFVATGLDGVWRLRAMHVPVRRRQPVEQVHLHYHRDDATRSFSLHEQPAGAPPFFVATGREPQELEHAGTTVEVVPATDDAPIAGVRLTRDGTTIEATSGTLGVDGLLEIVAGLRPAT